MEDNHENHDMLLSTTIPDLHQRQERYVPYMNFAKHAGIGYSISKSKALILPEILHYFQSDECNLVEDEDHHLEDVKMMDRVDAPSISHKDDVVSSGKITYLNASSDMKTSTRY